MCTVLGKGEYPILSVFPLLTQGQLTSRRSPLFSQREQNRSQEGRGRTVLHSHTGKARKPGVGRPEGLHVSICRSKDGQQVGISRAESAFSFDIHGATFLFYPILSVGAPSSQLSTYTLPSAGSVGWVGSLVLTESEPGVRRL